MTNWQTLTAAQKQEAVREAIETAGLTYSQAATALGAPGRTAIAGVVDRSKRSLEGRIVSPNLEGRPSAVGKPRRPKGRRNATQIVQEKARRARATANGADDEPVLAPAGDGRPLYERAWDALPGSNPVRLDDHTTGCRWPIQTAEAVARFCNAETDNHVYCAAHRQMGVRAEAPPAKRTVKGRLPAFNL